MWLFQLPGRDAHDESVDCDAFLAIRKCFHSSRTKVRGWKTIGDGTNTHVCVCVCVSVCMCFCVSVSLSPSPSFCLRACFLCVSVLCVCVCDNRAQPTPETKPSMSNSMTRMKNNFLAFLRRDSISDLEIKVGLSVRSKIGAAAAPDVMKMMQDIRSRCLN